MTFAVLMPILDVSAKPPERVQQQRSAARKALSHCAEIAGAPADGWQQSPGGAPLPNGEFYWSISHKRHWAAAAIARAPIGIDVEEIVPRRDSLLDEVVSAEDWHKLGGRTWDNFFRLWTAKEATLKANSVGIGHLSKCKLEKVIDDLHIETTFNGKLWHVEQLRWNHHIAAVTSGERPVHWELVPS